MAVFFFCMPSPSGIIWGSLESFILLVCFSQISERYQSRMYISLAASAQPNGNRRLGIAKMVWLGKARTNIPNNCQGLLWKVWVRLPFLFHFPLCIFSLIPTASIICKTCAQPYGRFIRFARMSTLQHFDCLCTISMQCCRLKSHYLIWTRDGKLCKWCKKHYFRTFSALSGPRQKMLHGVFFITRLVPFRFSCVSAFIKCVVCSLVCAYFFFLFSWKHYDLFFCHWPRFNNMSVAF